ncbi:hypothetical protein MMC30_004439 [Trapelia coarctata]|nr:hypothetical protein [Trapelia coarctata]
MFCELVISAVLFGLAQAQFASYLTRPGQQSLVIDILNNTNSAQLDPGYFFVAPYDDSAAYQGGPQIFDNDGNLVYDGYELVEKEALDFHVCDYLGGLGDHLCFNDARPIQQGGHSSGAIRFFDNTYTQVGGNFGATNGLIGPDIHELNTPAGYGGQIFLQVVYQTVPANLTAYDGPADGAVLSGCFQEIEIASQMVNFQWCSFDHVPLNQSYIPLNPPGDSIAGTGAADSPYDYFHLNSVDKDVNGDYLISSRQCDAIYKIAGLNSTNPGSIIWYLGGMSNSFNLEGNLNFSRQHMARFHQTSGTVTNILLFDNAYDSGSTPTAQTAIASSGMIISVDTSTMIARLLQQFIQPEGQLAVSQGALSILPTGNRLLGWGSIPAWSEYDSFGNLLYYARFSGPQSYRIWKFPFTAHPVTQPDILAYAQTCSSNLVVYLSWNGATEVKSWNLFGSTTQFGSYSSLGIYPKIGYETMVQINQTGFLPYIYAEALDTSGNLLNNTVTVPTFVPNAALACNSTQCPDGTNYTISNSIASSCTLPSSIVSSSSVVSSSPVLGNTAASSTVSSITVLSSVLLSNILLTSVMLSSALLSSAASSNTDSSSAISYSTVPCSTHSSGPYHPYNTHHHYHPSGYYGYGHGGHRPISTATA